MSKFIKSFVVNILFGSFVSYAMDGANENSIFIEDNVEPLSWSERVREYKERTIYGTPSSPNPQNCSRIEALKKRLGIESNSDPYLDKIEEGHLISVTKDLKRLLILLDPTKSTYDVIAIKLMQNSILSQLYRLARFRIDQIYSYLQLVEQINASNLKREIPLGVGPIRIECQILPNVEKNWTPFMKKSFIAWFNYILNTYFFKDYGDSVIVMNNIADLASFPELQIKLKEQLIIYLGQPHWCQIEYSYKQIFDEYLPTLECQDPYISIFPGISTAPERTLQPIYASILKKLILSNLLTKTISKEDEGIKLSIENFIKNFNNALLYNRLKELIRVFLSPIESLTNDSPIGKRLLKDEETNYALSDTI